MQALFHIDEMNCGDKKTKKKKKSLNGDEWKEKSRNDGKMSKLSIVVELNENENYKS